jgi:hypothetical protein
MLPRHEFLNWLVRGNILLHINDHNSPCFLSIHTVFQVSATSGSVSYCIYFRCLLYNQRLFYCISTHISDVYYSRKCILQYIYIYFRCLQHGVYPTVYLSIFQVSTIQLKVILQYIYPYFRCLLHQEVYLTVYLSIFQVSSTIYVSIHISGVYYNIRYSISIHISGVYNMTCILLYIYLHPYYNCQCILQYIYEYFRCLLQQEVYPTTITYQWWYPAPISWVLTSTTPRLAVTSL